MTNPTGDALKASAAQVTVTNLQLEAAKLALVKYSVLMPTDAAIRDMIAAAASAALSPVEQAPQPPSPETHLVGEIGDLRDQRASLIARGIDPNLDHIPDHGLMGRWLPIEQADKAIIDVQEFAEVGMTLRNSDTYWVRDEDGRVYEAAWTEGRYGRDFWWDWEAESPVDPVEFMPHPLDPQFATSASEVSE